MARGDATALAGLIVFIVLFAGFSAGGVYFYRKVEAEPEGGGSGGLRYKYKEKKAELKSEKALLEEEQEKLDVKLVDLEQAQKEYKFVVMDLNRVDTTAVIFKERKEMSDIDANSADVVKRNVVDAKEGLKDGLQTQKQSMDDEQNQVIKEVKGKIDNINKDVVKETERKKRIEEDFMRKRDTHKSKIAQAEDELTKMTAREAERAEVRPDGKLLKVDEPTKLAIINVGKAHGVKKGFIFEVFQIKGGNRRVHKGMIEVKTVDEETSAATILVREIRLPRCPNSGYAAMRPEERFSPYDSGGQSGLRVVKLQARPKEVIWGMNPDDPMAEGDLIYSPFFDPGSVLRFTVKGDDHIAYTPEEIVRSIKWHGGIVDDEVTATTDYLVSQRWAQDPIKKARELGVPILYEFDVFRFLRH